jgi:hypothetical protein
MSTYKPIDDLAAEALLNLSAEHGLAEVLDYLADHYRSLPEGFEKPLPACVKIAEELDKLAPLAKAADNEMLAEVWDKGWRTI